MLSRTESNVSNKETSQSFCFPFLKNKIWICSFQRPTKFPKSIKINQIIMIIILKKIPFFHAQLELDIHPDMSLHISLNTAYSSYEPSSFMSSLVVCIVFVYFTIKYDSPSRIHLCIRLYLYNIIYSYNTFDWVILLKYFPRA